MAMLNNQRVIIYTVVTRICCVDDDKKNAYFSQREIQ